jgi:hypothetical protein
MENLVSYDVPHNEVSDVRSMLAHWVISVQNAKTSSRSA